MSQHQLTVRVRDAAGQPVEGAAVSVRVVDPEPPYTERLDWVSASGTLASSAVQVTPATGDVVFRLWETDDLELRSWYRVDIVAGGHTSSARVPMTARDQSLAEAVANSGAFSPAPLVPLSPGGGVALSSAALYPFIRAMLVEGTNVTILRDDTGHHLRIAAGGSGGSGGLIAEEVWPFVKAMVRASAGAGTKATIDETARTVTIGLDSPIPDVPAKATNADVDAETDDNKYMTVAKVFRALARKVKVASRTVAGQTAYATNAQADAAEADAVDTTAVTPQTWWRMFTGARIVERLAALTGTNRLSLNDLRDVPEKATDADVDAETNDVKYVTVAKVFRAIARKVKVASRTVAGQTAYATNAQADASESDAVDTAAITPSSWWRMFTGARIIARIAAETGASRLSLNALKDVPGRLGAFTEALQTKLAGIAAGAQVNAPHNVKFSVTDGDTQTDVEDSQMGLLKSDNTQWSGTGDESLMSEVVAIEIPFAAAALGSNIGSPSTDLDAVDLHPLFGDAVDKGGAILLAINRTGYTQISYVQAETISKQSDHYALGSLTWINPYGGLIGDGNNWNVVAAVVTSGVLTKDIADWAQAHAPYVKKTDLAGHENDVYASYDNAPFGGGDVEGQWCLFDTASQPTDDTDAVAQPTIATGSGYVLFGRPRNNRDPNVFSLAPALAAAQYPSGMVIHATVEGANPGHVRITLTGAGVLVGTGNAAKILAPASWVEVGNVGPAAEGNWWRLSDIEPPPFIVRVLAEDVIGAPWVKPTGVQVNDDALNTDTQLLLENGDRTTLGEVVEWHDESHVGTFTITGLSYATDTTPDTAGQINFAVNLSDSTRGVISYKYGSASQRNTLKKKIVVGRDISIAQTGPTAVLKGVVSGTPADIFGRLSFNIRGVVITGTLTNGASAALTTDSNIPARSQLSDVAFSGAAADVSVDASAFDGVLDSNDTTVQAVADALDAYAPPKPTVSDVLTVTSSWQTIEDGFADDDVVEASTEGAYSNESNNIAMTSITNKFSSYSTSARWLGVRANSGGARIESRRNGTALQARSQGSTANTRAWTVKY